MEELENKLIDLSDRLRDITEKEYLFGERFNVFDALTRHHLEELHTKFISYLLKPDATHDCGSIFLHEFVKIISHLTDLKITENSKIFVQREFPTNYGRIDIYCELDGYIIAIENKIFAGEQIEQLPRYYEYCLSTRKNFLLFYLTIDGVDAEQTKRLKGNEDIVYYKLSYRENILNWLNKCKEIVATHPKISQGIDFYLGMLNNNILNVNETYIMDIENILAKKDHAILVKNFEQIKKAVDNIWESKRQNLFTLIYNNLTKNKLSVIPTIRFEEKKINEIISSFGGLKITNSEYIYYDKTTNNKIIFAIEHNSYYLYYGLVILSEIDEYKSPSQSELNEDLLEKIKLLIGEPTESKGDDWFFKKYFDYSFGEHEFTYDLILDENNIADEITEKIELFINKWQSVIIELNK